MEMKSIAKVITRVEERDYNKEVRLTFADGTQQTVPGSDIQPGYFPRVGDHWRMEVPLSVKPYAKVPQLTPFAPHQQRVVDEKADNDERMAKLGAFMDSNPLFGKLDEAEQKRMARQHSLMFQLSIVLGERIAAFE